MINRQNNGMNNIDHCKGCDDKEDKCCITICDLLNIFGQHPDVIDFVNRKHYLGRHMHHNKGKTKPKQKYYNPLICSPGCFER